MSTLSSQADLSRILSREEEADARYYHEMAHPHIVPDSVYFDHVGAHFPSGSRKGSLPDYPDGFEVSEDEAAAAQPGVMMSGALYTYQLQLSHNGGPQHVDPSTPTRGPAQDRSCISREGFKELKRQRSGKRRRSRGSIQSQQSQGSTPTQTHEASASTISGHSENDGPTTAAPPRDDTPHLAASAAFSESHTPSGCSVATDEDDMYREGVGPSPPHPFSKWDLYESEYRPDDRQLVIYGHR